MVRSQATSCQDFAASVPATRGSLPPLDPASLKLYSGGVLRKDIPSRRRTHTKPGCKIPLELRGKTLPRDPGNLLFLGFRGFFVNFDTLEPSVS